MTRLTDEQVAGLRAQAEIGHEPILLTRYELRALLDERRENQEAIRACAETAAQWLAEAKAQWEQRDGVILALREALERLVHPVLIQPQPTIEELERILEAESTTPITILPSGEVRVSEDHEHALSTLTNTAPAAAEAIARIEAPLRARISEVEEAFGASESENDALRAQLTRQRAEVLDEVATMLRNHGYESAWFLARLREMKAQPPTSGSE